MASTWMDKVEDKSGELLIGPAKGFRLLERVDRSERLLLARGKARPRVTRVMRVGSLGIRESEGRLNRETIFKALHCSCRKEDRPRHTEDFIIKEVASKDFCGRQELDKRLISKVVHSLGLEPRT